MPQILDRSCSNALRARSEGGCPNAAALYGRAQGSTISELWDTIAASSAYRQLEQEDSILRYQTWLAFPQVRNKNWAEGRTVHVLRASSRGMKDEEAEIMGRIRNNERVESYETVRVGKDGKRIHVSPTISPIHDANGKVVGASKIARDITASKASERRIRVLLREINHRVKTNTR